MPRGLGNAAYTVAQLVEYYGPTMQRSCNEWMQLNIQGHPCRTWALSVFCGVSTVDAHVSGQTPVQDATAPPSARISPYRVVAPMTLSYKARGRRRRSHGGNDDGGPEWDEGGFGGSGGSDNGRGGDDFWGRDWHEEGWWWGEAGDAALNAIYQVACWISLSHCLHFALAKVLTLLDSSVDDSDCDSGAFTQCSSVFVSPDLKDMLPVMDQQMARLRWRRTST